jgi:hypothetical protein
MIKVEVLYFEGCPNHAPTVELVRKTVGDLGLESEIAEIEVKSAEDAERLRFLGSPTVLVDGVDIEPQARESKAYAFACRTYPGSSGLPPQELVRQALEEAAAAAERGGEASP